MIRSASLNIESEDFLTLTINDIAFYCQYSKSSSGQFLLAYQDGNPFASISGNRSKAKGYYFLLKYFELIVIGQVERPNDGKVANNGYFIINDWLFDNDTKSITYAFDNIGNKIFKKTLKANLLTNCISGTGHFALYKTCNSNNSDNNILLLCDLFSNNILWKKKLIFPNPDRFSIVDNQFINLHYKDQQIIALNWDCKQVLNNNTRET